MRRPHVCVRCAATEMRLYQARLPFCFHCRQDHLRESLAAGALVRRAINRGDLPPAKECVCVDCGAQAYEYDHRDYTEPLVVDSVCRSCNQRRGMAFSSFYRPQVQPA